jgi:V8-like Glu-specific endopeptidase
MTKYLFLLLLPSVTFCQVREPWIHNSKDKWPTIALVNNVLYKNGDRHQDPSVSYVGTGFLLNTGNDTLAVTVKHALYAARNKKTDRVVVNEALEKWKMYPKNNPKDSVIIGYLINEDSSEMLFTSENGVLQRDWLVFTTTSISPNIRPLTLTNSPVNVGQRVHMIGNPYAFQNTLSVSGTIVKKSGEHLFVKLDGVEKHVLGGASGSPILDHNGHLIGIFSNSKRNPKTGEVTYIINNTDYLKRILKREKPLNADRRSVAKWLDSLLQHKSIKQALNEYVKMIEDPASENTYELHYIDWGHVQKTAKGLLQSNRTNDAISFLGFFTSRHPELAGFYILLAEAHKQNKDHKKATATLERALTEVYEEDKADLLKLLDEFKTR